MGIAAIADFWIIFEGKTHHKAEIPKTGLDIWGHSKGKRVTVSHSSVTVGIVGCSRHAVSWAQHLKSRVHPSPFTAFSIPFWKKVPIYCWVERENFPTSSWQTPDNPQPFAP